MQAAPLHWELRAHTQGSPSLLASLPRIFQGTFNLPSFVVSNLWGCLEQMEVAMTSASVCAFLRTSTWEVAGERWNIFLSCCTQLSWQLSSSTDRVKGNLRYGIPGKKEMYMRECLFWEKLSLAHSLGVWWCPAICTLQQYNSPRHFSSSSVSWSTKYLPQTSDKVMK